MAPLRDKMIKAMQLRGFAPTTQQRYWRVVTKLAPHYDKVMSVSKDVWEYNAAANVVDTASVSYPDPRPRGQP